MKPKVKVMLLGMTIALIGIYLRCLFIGYLYSALVEYIWFFLPPIGFLIALYGFFSKDKDTEEDLPEKIYEILRKQQRDAEEDVVCPKCGEKYKESYNACPWCGHKKAE